MHLLQIPIFQEEKFKVRKIRKNIVWKKIQLTKHLLQNLLLLGIGRQARIVLAERQTTKSHLQVQVQYTKMGQMLFHGLFVHTLNKTPPITSAAQALSKSLITS